MSDITETSGHLAKLLEPYARNAQKADGYCKKHETSYIKVISSGWVGCPKCHLESIAKKAEERGQKCYEEEVLRKQQYYLKRLSIMDDELAEASFENFRTDTDRQKEVLEWAKEMGRYYYKGGQGNILLIGDTGRGKSHLAYSIVKALSESQKTLATMVNVMDLLAEIKSDFSQEQFWMDKLKEVDYLVLDDLGAERSSDWATSLIYSILNKRSRTIITSNLSPDKLSDRYGKRVASRILKGCTKERIMRFDGLEDERRKLWT